MCKACFKYNLGDGERLLELSGNPFPNFQVGMDESRKKLLNSLDNAQDITLIIYNGNIGDDLIVQGTHNLLQNIQYRPVFIRRLQDLDGIKGHTALIRGGGAWCRAFPFMATVLPVIEERFEQVVIMPSSFDTKVDSVFQALSRTKATVFARELISYQLIKDICQADYAYDCAFFFDFAPYRRKGQGILHAYRTDRDSAFKRVPPDNNDISLTCADLNQWLETIAAYETVKTDRAHVMIAAAMLGKKVLYRPNKYHKVRGIAQFSLGELDVTEEVQPFFYKILNLNSKQLKHRRNVAGPLRYKR